MPPQTRTPSLARRLARLARLALHVVRGLYIVSTRYPRMTIAAKDRLLRRWSRELLAIMRVKVRIVREPRRRPERWLLVTNHVSWLDVFVIYAVAPSLFVAKSEIRDWPLVGALVSRVGTLFLERGRSRHARETNGRIAQALADGRAIAVCPEGTTSEGNELKRFHAALLQPAVEAQATVQPVALRYRDAHGEPTTAAAYVGDTSLMTSVWRILSHPGIQAEVRFTPAIATAGHDRRSLAHAAETAIRQALGLAGGDRSH